MKKIFFIIISFTFFLKASLAKKEVFLKKISSRPVIDGKLEEDFWAKLPELKNFIQFAPYNGQQPSQKSVVKVGYNNEAIYIAAELSDSSPDSIYHELSRRDDTHGINSDKLSIFINPFNDGINSFYFTVTAAGVQSDLKITGKDRDRSWDPVWKSRVDISDNGWTAEIEIPYSSLRFPADDIQKWGFNVFRTIKRYEEQSVWSHIERDSWRWWKEEQGTLRNIKNIQPPLRLSFTPYLSAYLQQEGKYSGYSYNGGLDLRYGINESFTLDMTLIPDFGQVQADNDVLNLSPFEIHHKERRPFFMEETQLFNKSGIFYSRRIGSQPDKYGEVEDRADEKDSIMTNPDKSQLLNAVKLTGRTSKGLGIGILNAITNRTFARLHDYSTGEIEKIKTQPVTNYNILVFDKNLRRNSFFNITNTNKYNNNYMANVTSSSLVYENEAGYTIGGKTNLSQQHYDDSSSIGYKLEFQTEKNKGKYQYDYRFSLENDTYNPNDMGFMRRNNEINHRLKLEYNLYKPEGAFLNTFHTIDLDYETLYKPYEFTEFEIGYHNFSTFKSHNSIFVRTKLKPVLGYDYYEPRRDGRYFITPKRLSMSAGFFQDDRKKIFFRLRGGTNWSLSDFSERYSYFFNMEPNLRLNSRMKMNYDLKYRRANNDRGWVDEDDQNIIFGKRNVRTITNSMNLAYIFNNTSSLDFYFRHYWSVVDYFHFYHLQDNGYLKSLENYNENQDINYNSINLRMNFLWRFAPGSELSLVWQKQVYSSQDDVHISVMDNLINTLSTTSNNSVSMKILYYLDSLKLFG